MIPKHRGEDCGCIREGVLKLEEEGEEEEEGDNDIASACIWLPSLSLQGTLRLSQVPTLDHVSCKHAPPIWQTLFCTTPCMLHPSLLSHDLASARILAPYLCKEPCVFSGPNL